MTGRLPLAAAFAFGLIAASLPTGAAQASPALVVDLDSGDILHQQEATRSWYPASVTKLMTAYVALDAVRRGRLTLDTPMRVSPRAARMAPSKMGFKPGSEVTLDNALKIIMVKSANDVSVTIAEGVSGSVEGFAAEMNSASARLGMTQSHWVNPNGLPNDAQVTSARDMAILARALHRDFPEHRDLWGIGAIQFGSRYMGNHNGLIGRYPGADGMKTGFTCAAGFNVVATASRGGRRLIAVVLGEASASERTARAAQLFDRGFAGGGVTGNLSSLAGGGIGPAPNMRGVACVRRGRGGGWVGEEEDFSAPLASNAQVISNNPALEMVLQAAGRHTVNSPAGGRSVAALPKPRFEPVIVALGRAPGWTGPAVGPGRAPAAEVAAAPAGGRPARGKPAPAEAEGVATTAFAPPKPRVLDGTAAPLAADAGALPLRLTGATDETAQASGKASGKPNGKAKAVRIREAGAQNGKPKAGKAAVGKPAAARPVAAKAKPADE